VDVESRRRNFMMMFFLIKCFADTSCVFFPDRVVEEMVQ
jgi:hypothetical protein